MTSTTSSASLLVTVSLSSSRALACKQQKEIREAQARQAPCRRRRTSVSLIRDSSWRVVMGVESAECAWDLRDR